MAQFKSDNIEQLDLALDQIALNDRNYDRFAYMLIDNVMELTLHKIAEKQSVANRYLQRLNPNLEFDTLLKKALGQNFSDKVKFAEKNQLLSADESTSIMILHQYRNTSYHGGDRHEGILRSMAILYFDITCNLLKKYEPMIFYSSQNRHSYRLKKNIGSVDFLNLNIELNNVLERYLFAIKEFDRGLLIELSTDMKKIIEETDDNISYLEDNMKKDRNMVIHEIQAWEFITNEKANCLFLDNKIEDKNTFFKVEWLLRNTNTWTCLNDPISSWNKRLKNIEKLKNNHLIIKNYYDFIRQTEPLRIIITNAVMNAEYSLNQQLDSLRGK